MSYDIQQVCLNGHQITANYGSYPEFRRAFCEKCGAATVHECPVCKTSIKGHYHVDGFLGLSPTPVPKFCEKCGTAYPWASKTQPSAKREHLDPKKVVERICARFPLIARQLQKRHASRPTIEIGDEYDVQDLLYGLLLLNFDDVRAEEYTPSYAGKSTRMDFLLKAEHLVVEAKMTRKGLGAREVGEQLIVDIAHYRSHPDVQTLVCFVFDPVHIINNPRGIERDLSTESKEFEVAVYVVPRDH